ncbi:MAG TPA: UDP-N-acetylmuramate--L-alanine ligase [Anaerolineae bacterium]|nr:UDP-N-acetylmuramate--L-alanine ligase [Anaerolineae bacterium]HID84648.1 UDP-N-acetylmuramate--L-alanine ligase [Anaerolineales bacterium]HIQ08385.1 UDP-N-acetylmuramate--L-alanine ligase [Anaerolineaceae bacterium]
MVLSQRIHFVGIGGTGLSAIARVLLERGYTVSGSDRHASPFTEALARLGARVFIGHAPEQVRDADLVVRSSAIPDDNPEVQESRARGIPVLKRVDFLPQLTAGYRTLAVAGAHGKTTTTAMLAVALQRLGQDPTFIVGAEVHDLGANAHAGKGPYFVIEADEYDYMFWGLRPYVAVVTNVEHDHPDLFPTPEAMQAAFRGFVERGDPEGWTVLCGEDAGARRLAEHAPGRVLFYGIRGEGSGVWLAAIARGLSLNPRGGYDFRAGLPSGREVAVSLSIPGRHNVLNALAALTVVDVLGLDVQEAARSLAAFHGAGRRFEVRLESGGWVVVDDYAHHPTEIAATLAAARARYPGHTLWAVWQPHTYSRTLTLLDRFATAFAQADRVVVTGVYAARERAPEGFDPRQVAAALRHPTVAFAPDWEAAAELLLAEAHPPAVVLVLSAGDGPRLSERLQAAWLSEERRG